MQKTILIDLDITLFDIDQSWINWLHKRSESTDLMNLISGYEKGEVDYNISSYFTLEDIYNPFDFWKEDDTYVNCNIHPDAVEVITHLFQAGYKIIFCTYCMQCGVQYENKASRIAKEFGHIDYSFVATKDKGVIKCDYFIDDRHTFLNQTDAKTILYKSPYKQEEPLTKEVVTVNSWSEVEDYFIDELGAESGHFVKELDTESGHFDKEIPVDKLINTSWCVMDWTKEQKIEWQEHMFSLGFEWKDSGKRLSYFDNPDIWFYYIGKDKCIIL